VCRGGHTLLGGGEYCRGLRRFDHDTRAGIGIGSRSGDDPGRSPVTTPEAGNLADGDIVSASEGRAKSRAGLLTSRELARQIPADFNFHRSRRLRSEVGIEGDQPLEHVERHSTLGGKVVQCLLAKPTVFVLDTQQVADY